MRTAIRKTSAKRGRCSIGYGVLQGEFVVRQGLDLTKPAYEQVLELDRKDREKQKQLEKLRSFQGRLPANFKFDRDDANSRQEAFRVTDHSQSREPEIGNGKTLSGREILLVFAALALVCVGGYFFLMKLVDVSRQDDCILAHRRDCGPRQGPFRQ